MPASHIQKSLTDKLPELIFYFFLYSFILITIIAIFVPFYPTIVYLDVAKSWAFGLNQALGQHLEFGKDIIFTFGPYSFLFSAVYHPTTYVIMLITSLYFALSYFLCFLLVSKGTRPLWSIIFCIGLIFAMVLRDTIFLMYPLLLGLAVFKIVSSERDSPYKSKWDLFQVVFLFFPLGLLVLIKGTMLIMSVCVATLCFLFFIINKKYYLGVAGFLSLFTSTLFFWGLAGQPIINLPDFFITIVPLILGYSEAMQITGNDNYIILFLFPSILLLISILWEMKGTLTSKLFLFFLYFCFLFMSFKASFVVQNNHDLIASSALIMGALLLPFIFQTRVTMVAIWLSVSCGAYITEQYTQYDSWKGILQRIGNLYALAGTGFVHSIQDYNWPQHDFEIGVNSIKKQVPLPLLEGTTDIYSWDQEALIASGNTWSPRPIFQSYSAYTESLVLKNREYLLGNKAPNNIIFRIEPVNGNLPSIEDGASWPVLLSHYQPVQMENEYLILRKRQTLANPEKVAKYESKVESFRKNVEVPHSNQLIYAKLDIHPTVLGSLANIAFKSSQLHIILTLNSGEVRTYRMVSGMAKAGFLISPLVEDTKDFRELYEKTNIDKNRVKYFSIEGNNMLWNDKYTVTFSENDI